MKTSLFLSALLTLAMLLPQTMQAQEIWEVGATFSIQDGSTPIEVQGNMAFTFHADSIDVRKDTKKEEIDVYSWSWGSTNATGQSSLEPSTPLSRCATGTLKEAAAEVEGGRISVQRCSEEDGPLTLSPLEFIISNTPPQRIAILVGLLLPAVAEEIGEQCLVDEADSLALCLHMGQ